MLAWLIAGLCMLTDGCTQLVIDIANYVGRQEAKGHHHPAYTTDRVVAGECGLQTGYLDVTAHSLCITEVATTLRNARQHVPAQAPIRLQHCGGPRKWEA